MSIPYASASSGLKARDEIIKLLRNYGCESVGFMDLFESKTVLLAFSHRGRDVQLRANAQGWANAFLKDAPWSYRRQGTEHQYKEKALNQGMIAVNSILRDWIKGQMTAVETGILSFEGVFMPYMLTNDGRTLADRAHELLPPPKETA